MNVLNWITDNWVNILAFMGALNMFAQTLTRFNKNGKEDGLANKTITGLNMVASLGMKPKVKRAEGDDSTPV